MAAKSKNEQRVLSLIAVLSIVVPIAVAILMILPEEARLDVEGEWVKGLPFFHAVLNGSTAVMLLLGGLFIKSKMLRQHKL
ncbi:DUF420 domain-containing protein, partial [Arthrospira sp. O9.13F]